MPCCSRVFYRTIAQTANQHLQKGDPLLIEGELTYRQYQDQNDQTKYITEIKVQQFYFLRSAQAPSQTPNQTQSQTPTEGQDDLPF